MLFGKIDELRNDDFIKYILKEVVICIVYNFKYVDYIFLLLSLNVVVFNIIYFWFEDLIEIFGLIFLREDLIYIVFNIFLVLFII